LNPAIVLIIAYFFQA